MADLLRALIDDLEAARKPDADAENVPRSTILAAVDAVHRYLLAAGIEDRLRAPFLELIGAIQDIDAGKHSPILSAGPFRPAGQVHLQMDIAEFAMASAAVQFLRSVPGESTDRALSRLARVIGTDKETLREFRKNIGRKRAHPDAIREHGEWIKIRERFKDIPTTDFVEIMIDKARRLNLKKKG